MNPRVYKIISIPPFPTILPVIKNSITKLINAVLMNNATDYF